MYFSICIAALIAAVNALTITSPTDGQILDPSQPITVTWQSTSSDPSTFDLLVDQPGGLTSNSVVATSISTTSGSYTLTANSVITYGGNFVFKARSATGEILATSPSFYFSIGAVVTNPQESSPAQTVIQTGSSAGNSAAATGTATDGASPTDAPSATSSGGSGSGSTVSGEGSTTLSGSMSGFSTSTTSTSSHRTSTSTSSSSSSSATTSANAQPRLASNSQIAFSAAGVLAGLAALLA